METMSDFFLQKQDSPGQLHEKPEDSIKINWRYLLTFYNSSVFKKIKQMFQFQNVFVVFSGGGGGGSSIEEKDSEVVSY